jgi:hypothetical protein
MTSSGRRIIRLTIAACLALAATDPVEADGTRPPESSWSAHVRSADEALARQDLPAAERAWHEAYIAALGAWRWEAPLEVGHASLRIGERSGARQTSAARARNLYLTGLLRAQQQGSLEGALRAAEAFAGLGDREGVAQCLRIAERLASEAGAAEAFARVRAAEARLADALPASRVPGP